MYCELIIDGFPGPSIGFPEHMPSVPEIGHLMYMDMQDTWHDVPHWTDPDWTEQTALLIGQNVAHMCDPVNVAPTLGR